MNNPLQQMLQARVIPTTAFPQGSRYYGDETRSYATPDGREISYLQRRLVPKPESFATLGYYQVKEGDRPDLLASRYLSDPIMFWRLCDANGVLSPDELAGSPGRTVRITLPQGVPGAGNA